MSNKLASLAKAALCAVFVFTVAQPVLAQVKKPKAGQKKTASAGPNVTQIDMEGLRALIKPKGRPLLINFWATWCDPCREEFPDLVKINGLYKGKIDMITVSLDDLADIKTYVPKFLKEMNAEMPAYLLKTADESAAITMVAKDWSGNLPLTILFAPSGDTAYIRMGKLKYETVAAEIDKALASTSGAISDLRIVELPKVADNYTFEKGVADAENELSRGEFRLVKYGMTPGAISGSEYVTLLKKYSLKITDFGCLIPGNGFPNYARGFNTTMKEAFQKKFGASVAQTMGMAGDVD